MPAEMDLVNPGKRTKEKTACRYKLLRISSTTRCSIYEPKKNTIMKRNRFLKRGKKEKNSLYILPIQVNRRAKEEIHFYDSEI